MKPGANRTMPEGLWPPWELIQGQRRVAQAQLHHQTDTANQSPPGKEQELGGHHQASTGPRPRKRHPRQRVGRQRAEQQVAATASRLTTVLLNGRAPWVGGEQAPVRRVRAWGLLGQQGRRGGAECSPLVPSARCSPTRTRAQQPPAAQGQHTTTAERFAALNLPQR